MAAYRPYGISPRLEVFTAERTWDSYDLLGFLGALPRAKVPRVVVLDNAGLHTSHVIRRARRDLAAAGIYDTIAALPGGFSLSPRNQASNRAVHGVDTDSKS